MRVLSTELSAHVGEHIRLAGWVHAQRSRRLSYVVLRDRAGLVQVVLSEPLKIVPETVVEVEARQSRQRRAPSGGELRKPTFRIFAQPEEPPPVELRRSMVTATLPTILDFAPVTLRHPRPSDPQRRGQATLAPCAATRARTELRLTVQQQRAGSPHLDSSSVARYAK